MSAEKKLYFVALIPPPPVETEIWNFKEEVREKFGSKAALRSPPHITLHMPFSYRADREEKIIGTLRKVRSEPIQLQLNGFSAFPPRVIYVDVLGNTLLDDLQQQTGVLMRPYTDNESTRRGHCFNPHVTIAFRDLNKESFNRCWQYFRDRSYEREFTIDSLWLLRHTGKHWEKAREISFIHPGG